MVIEKYSRYTDNKQRLFVIIERWSKVDVGYKGKNMFLTPTTITLLNVHAETVQVLTHKEMEEHIKQGRLIKIEKPT